MSSARAMAGRRRRISYDCAGITAPMEGMPCARMSGGGQNSRGVHAYIRHLSSSKDCCRNCLIVDTRCVPVRCNGNI
jgi:hypothetical protein